MRRGIRRGCPVRRLLRRSCAGFFDRSLPVGISGLEVVPGRDRFAVGDPTAHRWMLLHTLGERVEWEAWNSALREVSAVWAF
jgi:hypothetical protein